MDEAVNKLQDKAKEFCRKNGMSAFAFDPVVLKCMAEFAQAEGGVEVERLREESRRYYLADGTFELLDSPEAVIERRKDAAKKLAEAGQSADWVATADRLPADGEPVLVSVDTSYNDERRMKFVQIQAFYEGEWETQDVVAWRPLPQPYKQPEENHGG